MFCPKCAHPNPAEAEACVNCQQNTSYFRERVFIGRQFIFVQADDTYPVALAVDGEVQTYQAPTILSRHQHSVSFGDVLPTDKRRDQGRRFLSQRLRALNILDPKQTSTWPLPDQHQLPAPSLEFLTVVTDRKIYPPDGEVALFIVAPDAPGSEVSLEIQLAGHKVYETEILLNQNGLALHHHPDLKEGEYTAVVRLPGRDQAECTFSVAEYTLSPLIATLEEHEYAGGKLAFTLKLLLLSLPYSGPLEFGLQCQVCGERVVATQQVKAQDGLAQGEFDISGHGGPFHVQVTTPDGNTALVAFPGTGAVEREHIQINPLGQTTDMGLLPWEDAQPIRGFYIGAGEVNMTPLTLESVHADQGKLLAASDLSQVQLVTFRATGPEDESARAIEIAGLKRGDVLEFDVEEPYTLFTVGAFTRNGPFEGWGIVVKPVAFEAALTASPTAQPGQTIDVYLHIDSTLPSQGEGPGERVPNAAFCWLLVYDARLEHESPVPKLAKRVYESVRNATGNLVVGGVPNAHDQRWAPPDDIVRGAAQLAELRLPGAPMRTKTPQLDLAMPFGAMTEVTAAAPAPTQVAAELPTMVVAPTRMEFPELAYSELFYLEGTGSRTVKLGDQIGTWRVRAYVFQGADYRELTADVQASKPLYAELDLPAIASEGDEISAAVNYNTREPANLLIATPFGETRAQVGGSGTQHFPIQGPGRVEVRLEGEPGAEDWTMRDVAPPGVQKVTASRLVILDRGQTARGEKVVIYASMGQVLKDTITALISYPFG